MDSKQISLFEDRRNSLVKQSTKFILNSRNKDMTAQELKVVKSIITYIRIKDIDFETYTFDLKSMCFLFGIKPIGQNFDNLKKSIKSLADKSVWLRLDNKEYLFRWFESIVIDYSNYTISFSINDELKPFLLKLGEDNPYTGYELGNILLMESKYAINLYEVLKHADKIGTYEDTVENLKLLLDCAEYGRYNNFKVRVLDIAVEEINKYTDIEISYIPIRQNRKIVSIRFTISVKEKFEVDKLRVMRDKKMNKRAGIKNE